MACKQLGGAVSMGFHAGSCGEIAEMSKRHGMEMFQRQDAAHLRAMEKMQELRKNPDAMKSWFEARQPEFETLPET